MSSLCAGLLWVLCAQQPSWWNPDWSHRRAVTTQDPARGREPSDAAIVEFTTHGKMRDDGADVRVIDATGAELPCRVLRGTEDKAVVVFPAKRQSRYTVYFGNEKASPAASWEPEAGLLLEVRARPDGRAGTWDQMKDLIAKKSEVYGRALVPTIAYGFNPLGPNADVLLLFTGWLSCPEDGEYEFATNSFDASFLLVDGKVVAEWGGWHSPRGGEQGGHSGKVALKKGRHKVEYVNAVRDKGLGLAAGWKPPSAQRIATIPAGAWVGGYLASAGPVETRAGAPPADFHWAVTSDLGLDDREVTAFQFTGRSVQGATAWRWDFGDGTAGAEQNPAHVYLENGTYTVRLDVTLKDGKARTGTNRVRVQPQRGQWAHGYEQRLASYARIVKDYPADRLSGKAAMEMGRLCLDAGQKDGAIAGLAQAVAKGTADFKSRDHLQLVMALYNLYREKREWAKAIGLCDAIIGSPIDNVAARAMAAVGKGEVLLEAGELDKAEELLRSVADRGGQTDYARLARIRVGDALLARGKRAEATAVYEDVQTKWKKFYGDLEMTEGNHSLSFHGYLRQREYEAAEKEVQSLVWETPTAQLTGYPRLLLGKLREAQGRWEDAAAEYGRSASADPSATHVPEALVRLAKAQLKLGRKDEARAALEKCAREYPESPEADAARQELERIR